MGRDSGIYKIICSCSDQVYIGSAVSLRKRWMEHKKQLRGKRHHNRYLQHAWNKYGESAFELKILVRCAPEDLIFFEQRFIDAYEWDSLYNLSPTAWSQLGYRFTEEQRKRLSESHKGQIVPDHVRELSRQRRLGKTHSKEVRKKISMARKGNPLSEEHKLALREAHKTCRCHARFRQENI